MGLSFFFEIKVAKLIFLFFIFLTNGRVNKIQVKINKKLNAIFNIIKKYTLFNNKNNNICNIITTRIVILILEVIFGKYNLFFKNFTK